MGTGSLRVAARKQAGESPARSRHCELVPFEGIGESDTSCGQLAHDEGRWIPEGDAPMSIISIPGALPRTSISTEALSKTRVAVILSVTILLALGLYYMVGVEEGMTHLFGNSMVIHEWVHDARHFLGFPCH
jgi:cobalt transporter subunit CbtB